MTRTQHKYVLEKERIQLSNLSRKKLKLYVYIPVISHISRIVQNRARLINNKLKCNIYAIVVVYLIKEGFSL